MQRVVLLCYDADTRRITWRQYSINAQPSGVASKGVKALVAARKLPDMGNLEDVAEYVTRGGYGSVRRVMFCVTPHNPWTTSRLAWHLV